MGGWDVVCPYRVWAEEQQQQQQKGKGNARARAPPPPRCRGDRRRSPPPRCRFLWLPPLLEPLSAVLAAVTEPFRAAAHVAGSLVPIVVLLIKNKEAALLLQVLCIFMP